VELGDGHGRGRVRAREEAGGRGPADGIFTHVNLSLHDVSFNCFAHFCPIKAPFGYGGAVGGNFTYRCLLLVGSDSFLKRDEGFFLGLGELNRSEAQEGCEAVAA